MPDGEDSVEIGGRPVGGSAAASGPTGRPFLRLYFRCANVYQRAYRSPDGTQYTARCPKCGQTMRFAVGPGGTSERFFQVTCQ